MTAEPATVPDAAIGADARWWGDTCPRCAAILPPLPDLWAIAPPTWELRCAFCGLVLVIKGELPAARA